MKQWIIHVDWMVEVNCLREREDWWWWMANRVHVLVISLISDNYTYVIVFNAIKFMRWRPLIERELVKPPVWICRWLFMHLEADMSDTWSGFNETAKDVRINNVCCKRFWWFPEHPLHSQNSFNLTYFYHYQTSPYPLCLQWLTVAGSSQYSTQTCNRRKPPQNKENYGTSAVLGPERVPRITVWFRGGGGSMIVLRLDMNY